MPQLTQKGFAHILVIILLLVGVGVGIYLVQNPAIFKPRADSLQSSVACQTPENNYKKVDFGGTCFTNPFKRGVADGFKTVSVTCNDGFAQTIESPGCITEEGGKVLAQQLCITHSSCSQLNLSTGLHSGSAVKVDKDQFGEFANILFWVSNPEGFKILHTAVWEGVTNEEMAKKDGRQGKYQGFTSSISYRDINLPAYVEYYAVDKQDKNEILNKRLITNTPYAVNVTRKAVNGDLDYIGRNTLLLLDNSITPNNSLHSDSNEYRTLFNYLVPGDHSLSYIIPQGYKVDVETCTASGDLVNCIKTSPAVAEVSRYEVLPISLPTSILGGTVQVTLNYELSNNSVDTKPVPEVQVARVDCDTSGESKLNATLLIPREKEDIKHYAIRIDNKSTSTGWNGSCENPEAGDYCHDLPFNLNVNRTGYSFPAAPGQAHELWYHKVYKDGRYGEVSDKIQFTCSSGPESYTNSPERGNPGKAVYGTSANGPKDVEVSCTQGKVYVRWENFDDIKIRGAANVSDFVHPRSASWWNAREHQSLGDLILEPELGEIKSDTASAQIRNYTYDSKGEIDPGTTFDIWVHGISSNGAVSEPTYLNKLVTCN